jgi:crossover junction endodeoxyribonuclease RuvC
LLRDIPFATLTPVGITPQQFQQLQQRLNGGPAKTSRSPRPAIESNYRAVTRGNMVILGLDPSLRGTGFGIIKSAKPVPLTLAQGTVSCPAGWERSRCLVKIHQTIREMIAIHKPTVCAIEGLFYAQNFQTALIMGEARGAALAAIAEAGLDIYEMAPRKVKQAIVGYGAAQKIAVAKMVQRILHLAEPPAPDAADALALALAYAQSSSGLNFTAAKKV